MIYYDNAFRLRIRHTSVYQIHQHLDFFMQERKGEKLPYSFKEGANKQVISSQADSLIKISRIWADFFPANTSNQPI